MNNHDSTELAAAMARHPAGKGHPKPDLTLVPHIVTVTVKEPVDGTVKRKTRSDKGKERKPSVGLKHIRVDPEVWATAKRIKRDGERLVIVNESTVLLKGDR